MVSISIVFPVHNEERNIGKLIEEWHLELIKSNVDHEFIIVEDGSNVTVNYDNKGSIINAKFNSGNNVLFNIKQQ